MKKIVALVLAIAMLCGVSALADVTLGQVNCAAHGTKCFAVITAAVDGDTIVAAKIEEYQFMDAATAVGVPNSTEAFGADFPEGKVLASKVDNNGLYSTNMATKAGATKPLGVGYAAIEAYAAGKTIAELEAEVEGKTAEEMIDAVAGSTLADTKGYLAGIVAAAKAASNQVGYYTLYNKTGETVVAVGINHAEYGNQTVALNMEPDAVQVVKYVLPGQYNGDHTLVLSFVTESGYQAEFTTLSVETTAITLLAADALTGATPISFFPPAAE